MNDNLYAGSLALRLTATKSYVESVQEVQTPGCRGALNAWALFLGSNPGGGPEGDENTWKCSIGINRGLTGEPFVHGDRRNPKWKKLFLAVFDGNDEAVNDLSALCNLYVGSTRRESDVAQQKLSTGCEAVWKTGCKLRPRFVITLTNTTHNFFVSYLKSIPCGREIGNDKLPTIQFEWPDTDFSTFLVKSPRHPSWPMKQEWLMAFTAKVKELDHRA